MSDFCSDPQTYYTTHFRPMQHLPRTELEAAQLATLRSRFAALRQRIAPLTAMADQLGVDAIGALEDVVPLLFPHSFYKAYPTSLLDRRDFDAMTRWLGRSAVR